MTNQQLPKTIKLLMVNRGITEADLVRGTGLKQSTVHRILTGATRDPRQSNVRAIAVYFCVTLDQIYDADYIKRLVLIEPGENTAKTLPGTLCVPSSATAMELFDVLTEKQRHDLRKLLIMPLLEED